MNLHYGRNDAYLEMRICEKARCASQIEKEFIRYTYVHAKRERLCAEFRGIIKLLRCYRFYIRMISNKSQKCACSASE